MRLVCSFLAVAALSALSLSVFSSPAYAASGNAYYIDSNSPCRSGCDGKSPARAWDSPKDAEQARIPNGADICLMDGSVFHDTDFSINWNGSARDRVNVGTCYTAGSSTYWWWEGPRARQTQKAELNGTFDEACKNMGYYACAPHRGHQVPNSQWAGLVNVGGSFVTLRAFKVHDSAARGIFFSGAGQTQNHIIEMDVNHLYDSNFFHLGTAPSTRHIVRNNEFTNAGYRYSGAFMPRQSIGGTCFQFARGTHADRTRPAHGIFEGNIVGNCSGEAGFLDSSHNIIRGNIFYNTRNTGIYLDNVAHSVVEWNITYLASDQCDIYSARGNCGPLGNGTSAQGGARWQIEDYPAGCRSVTACAKGTTNSEDNVVRHNLYVWGEDGWGASMERYADAGNRLRMGKYYLHNTTHMATLRAFSDGNTPRQQLQLDNEVINNVLLGANSGAKSKCRGGGDRPHYEANVWSEVPGSIDRDCKGKNDEYGGNVKFRSAHPRPPRVSDRPTFADYEIISGNGDRSARNITNEVIPEISGNCSEFPQLKDLDPRFAPEINWKPSCSNWRKKAYYDYRGRFRGGVSDKGF